MQITFFFFFLKNGFDYVLTYFDDPKAMFPGPAYSWMATSGVYIFKKNYSFVIFFLVEKLAKHIEHINL